MKKYLSLFLLTLFFNLLTVNLHAETFEVDNITYETLENEDEVSVNEIRHTVKECILPEYVTYEGVSYKVTKIHSMGYQSYNLSYLTIPPTVSTIDRYAFSNCRNLNNVVFEDSNEAITVGDCWQYGEGGGPFYLCPLKSAYIGRNIIADYTIYSEYTNNYNNAIFPPKSIETVSFGENVTEISAGMFYGCNKIISIELPNSITKIGDIAFSGCTGLAEFHLPPLIHDIGEYAFNGCTGLSSIKLPNSVKTIGKGIFKDCSNLTNIILSSSLESIPFEAFYGVPIQSLSIPNSVVEVSNTAFVGCTNIKQIKIEDGENPLHFKDGARAFFDSKLESIYVGRNLIYKESPFYYQPNLLTCTIGKTVTIIPNSFLNEATSLTDVILPNSVTTIEAYAFNHCTSLSNIKLSDDLLFIGENAFNGCSSLKSMIIPGKVESINEKSFEGCSSLNEIKLDDGDTELRIYKGTFLSVPLESLYLGRNIISSGVSIYGSPSIFNSEKTLKTVTIGNKVTSIPEDSFNGCENLSSIIIPNSVKVIGMDSFKDCINLSNIVFGNSLESIKSCAFENCALTDVILPLCIAQIDYYAFRNNVKLENVVFGDSLKLIGIGAFSECEKLTNVTLPPNLRFIERAAFKGCKNITNMTIPNNVETIGKAAFYGCNLQADVFEIPNSIKAIGSDTFRGSYFKKLVIEDSNDYLSITADDSSKDYGSAFRGCLIDTVYIGRNITFSADKREQTTYGFSNNIVSSVSFGENVSYIPYEFFKGCRNLTNINLPDNIQTIGMSSFENCSNLSEVNMGNGVTTIGVKAFKKCTKLNSIKFGDSVNEIMESAFSDCRLSYAEFNANLTSIGKESFKGCSLRDIILPISLKTIEESAFSNNGKIDKISCIAVTPPSTANNAFDDIVKVGTPLYVPTESISRYEKAICWRDFYSIIGGESGFEDVYVDIEGFDVNVDIFSINGRFIFHGLIKDCNLGQGLYIIKSDKINKKILIQQ